MRRAVFVVLAACGRLHFDPLGDTDAAPGGDAVAACTTFSSWGGVTSLSQLSSTSEDYGSQISPDGLSLYFDSGRTGIDDLYVAIRPDRISAFGAPAPITELDIATSQSDPSVTADNLDLFFGSDRTGLDCIYEASRGSVANTWNAAVAVVCSGNGGSGPYISADGLTLYYSDPITNDLDTIVRSTRTGAFGVPMVAGNEINYPALSGDGLTIYFQQTVGHEQLFEATRTSIGAAFGAMTPIADIASTSDDADVSITADGLELYFASDRAGGLGQYDLYVATRTCL